MDNQTRNHLNLQKHIADQDHIIRVRNAEIAALRKRAEEWEKRARAAEQPRPLTAADITDEMIERARQAYNARYPSGAWSGGIRAALEAVLIAPARPESAEKVEAVLNQYWSGDVDGTDLADLIVEEMNR